MAHHNKITTLSERNSITSVLEEGRTEEEAKRRTHQMELSFSSIMSLGHFR